MSGATPLGTPIPNSEHAVSVSLPTWSDVVGYEENDPEVRNALQAGYPRFFLSPVVREAMELAAEEIGRQGCLLFPTLKTAELAQAFVQRHHPREEVAMSAWRGVVAISTTPATTASAMKFWQHAGLGISSRQAQALLDGAAPTTSDASHNVRQRIAALASVDASAVFLFPSGMAAMHAALQALLARRPKQATAQLCFPYLDTLKLQQEFVSEVFFHPKADGQALDRLSEQLEAKKLAGIFTEIPSNPLLQTIDTKRLVELAAQHKVPIVVDDSFGCLFNQDVLRVADLCVISLTKYFGGRGEVMGGALVLNPKSQYRDELSLADGHLFEGDAQALELGSRDFQERMKRVNETTATLCAGLSEHPAVETVFSCLSQTRNNYDELLLERGGHGGVFSLLLKDAEAQTPAFYDRLGIAKGPSFGMRETLCCPYTMLAHYDELDWAEAQGVSRYLIRFSVGLEDASDLLATITAALP